MNTTTSEGAAGDEAVAVEVEEFPEVLGKQPSLLAISNLG
jgi:hypothetical protein